MRSCTCFSSMLCACLMEPMARSPELRSASGRSPLVADASVSCSFCGCSSSSSSQSLRERTFEVPSVVTLTLTRPSIAWVLEAERGSAKVSGSLCPILSRGTKMMKRSFFLSGTTALFSYLAVKSQRASLSLLSPAVSDTLSSLSWTRLAQAKGTCSTWLPTAGGSHSSWFSTSARSRGWIFNKD